MVGKRPLLSNVRASLSCWRFQSVHGTVRRCGWPVSGIVHSWPQRSLSRSAKTEPNNRLQQKAGKKVGVRPG